MAGTESNRYQRELPAAAKEDPGSSPSSTSASKQLAAFLKGRDTKYIRLQWLDLAGILHVRVLPVSSASNVASSSRVYGVNFLGMSGPACGESLSPLPPLRLLELIPDWTSLRPYGATPGHATVACNVGSRSSKTNGEHTFPQCPRHLLSTILSDNQKLLAGALVGFELEFCLLTSSGAPLPDAGEIGQCWSSSAPIRGPALKILEEATADLRRAGIGVWHFLAQYSPLLEIALEPLPPLEAVDAFVHAQETVRQIAANHGLKATLAPRPWHIDGPFTAQHIHFSLPAARRDAQVADRFLAGIMAPLRALCAIGLPSPESLLCVQEGIKGAAVGNWVSWGTENRDGPVRKIEDGRWEIRIVDATANPYLMLAAVLRSGLCGVEKEKELTLKDCRSFPSQMSEKEKQMHGVVTKLPRTLAESLGELKWDPDLHSMMGDEMFDLYLRLREKDDTVFGTMHDEKKRQRFINMY